MADGRVERNTKQKELIHDALKASDEFISAQDLHRKLEDEDVKVGLATVYRQLNALAEAGEADTVRLEGQQLFRLCGDDGHHHHLVCTNCGKTVEIESPSETWLRGISTKYGSIRTLLRLPEQGALVIPAIVVRMYSNGEIIRNEISPSKLPVPPLCFCVFIGISIRKSEETVDEIDHYIFLSDIVAKMVP